MKKILVILLLNFLIFSNINAEEREKKLNILFNKLKNDTSIEISSTEKKIWKIWTTHPSTDRTGYRLTEMLAQGDLLMTKKDLDGALNTFSLIISIDSNWAEAWNKRATALYLAGRYEDSIEDIKKVLQLESRHFGALTGLGLVQIELKNYKIALESYEEARQIHPSMEAPKVMIPLLKELLKGQKI